ncbi:MAG: hypothetical protein WAO71_01450 [Gallionella sp.]
MLVISCSLRGRSVEQNFAIGRKYLEEAMQLGDPEAFCWTGYMYCRGIGVETDCQKGGTLMRQAAAKGSAVCSKLKL